MEHHEEWEPGCVECEKPLTSKHMDLHTLVLEVEPQLGQLFLYHKQNQNTHSFKGSE